MNETVDVSQAPDAGEAAATTIVPSSRGSEWLARYS